LSERNIQLTAAALQFPLRLPTVTSVLIGSRSSAELSANIVDIVDFDGALPESIWGELEAAELIERLK
jgi:aryl-alcohol dehydrogenase-like predicted oxidoreductase